MRYGHTLAYIGLVLTTLLLVSCGGGGSNPGDVFPGQPKAGSPVTGPNRFLLFPNPLVQPDGSFQTDSVAYATAYYAAFDPANAEDTLAKWKAVNKFDTAPGPLGQHTLTVGDTHDLGYGRRMTIRQNPDGTIAAMVNNYVVSPATAAYGTYTHLNVEAAAAQDNRWYIGTTAIEYSPAPGVKPGLNCLGCFAKFSFFAPSGNRLLAVDLDGRGAKAMPGMCASCHGGRLGPLTPAAGSPTGLPLFPLIQNSVSLARGDVQGRLHDLKVGTFDFSTLPGYTRADEEAEMKAANKIVLCSYPLPSGTAITTNVEDACRPVAGAEEWEGGNDIFIKNPYGGSGMPDATYADTYVPSGWAAAGQTTLYQNVVQDYCRTCHILRGISEQSDIDFNDNVPLALTDGYKKFYGYSDRIFEHVVDRGNMPLSKFVYDRFWSSSAPDLLSTWLEGLGKGYVAHDSAGALLKPGRPYAEPGPDRVVASGSTQLSAATSLYATTYKWKLVKNPGDGALTNPASVMPTFTATVNGTYVLQLVVGNGAALSAPKVLNIVVNNTLAPAPSAIRFADIKNILQALGGCITCHTTPSLANAARTPIVYNNVDRNGDGVVDATDDKWFYNELLGRINFTDIEASPLLRKPSNQHHVGGLQAGFDITLPPGDPGRAKYDVFLNWVLNGAPE